MPDSLTINAKNRIMALPRAGILILLLLISSTLCAGIIISGVVQDPDGHPIEGAVITDGRDQTLSDAEGNFRLQCSGDSLLVSRPGYQPHSLAVKGFTSPVILQVKPITLPAITISQSALELFDTAADQVKVRLDPDRHYYSAADILGSVSSIGSQDIRLKGEKQAVSILGNLSRHTLIVLDGIPLNPGGESFDLSLLDPGNIESIEVIRNNASVYGGSSAIGGIVRITSKQVPLQTVKDFLLSSELGSFGYARTSLDASTSYPNFGIRLKAGKFNTDNNFRYQLPDWWAPDSTARRLNNAKRQSSFSGSLSTRLRSFRITLRSDYEGFHRQLPGTVNFSEIYRHAYLEGFSNRNQLSFAGSLAGLGNSSQVWFNQDKTLYDNTRAPLPVYVNQYRQKLYYWGLRSSLSREFIPLPGLELTAGLAGEGGGNRYLYRNLLNSGQDIDVKHGFINACGKTGVKLTPSSWQITAAGALRYDHSGNDDNLSWRTEGSITWYGPIDLTLGGTCGTSFALPSPYDLYWKGDSQAIGNPDLNSETSRGWQSWLEVRISRFRLRSGIHENKIRNLIQWRQVQMFGNAWKPMNIGKARIRNLEAEAEFTPVDWLTLESTALLTEALDLSTLSAEEAPRLMYTPWFNFASTLRFSYCGAGLWIRYNFTGKQHSTPDNLGPTIGAYSLWDAGVSWRRSLGDWELAPWLNVRNLLNKRYEVYAYVPQPGIAFYGGLTLHFKD